MEKSSYILLLYILIYLVGYTLSMTNDSTGEKIKEKVKGTEEKVKETIGMEGGRGEGKEEELGPGAASRVEEEVAKTSSDSPTRRVEGPGKALGKEEDSK